MWIRLLLYACILPPIAVALGWTKRSHAVSVIAIGVAVCLAAWLWPRTRALVTSWYGRSRLLRAVDAVLWNLALVLIAGEVALRLASRVSNHPLLTSPSASAQARIEQERRQLRAFYGAAGVNARSYNDTDWRADPGDTFRIVALGDSFAFGVVGYEHNFLTLLERNLSARLGRAVEVANLGLPSMQPNDYLQILLDDGLALQPDLVLLCLYTGNDFQPAASASPLDASNWRVVGFATRLARYAAEREFRASTAAPAGAPQSGASIPAFSEDRYLEIAAAYVPLLRRERPAKLDRAMRETLALADEIVRRAAPTPVAIAVLPSEFQVSRPLRDRVLSRTGLAEADLDLERPARETRAHFAPREIPVIDLLAAFTAAEADESTYALRNTHWNERGNAVAAQALAEALAPFVRERSHADPGFTRGPENR
jgi:lysophospholipase L1-like esterase